MFRNTLLLLFVLAFVGISFCSNLNANEVKTYDFNSLSNGNLAGQDNWVLFGPGWTQPIISDDGPDGSKSLFSTASGSSLRYISRINDGNFSITDFSGDETQAIFQFDVRHSAWTTDVGLGYDDNSNNQIESSECGIRIRMRNDGNFLGIYLADGSFAESTIPSWPPNPAIWYTIRVVMDFTANSGTGAASVYYKEYGTTSYIQMPGLQNIDMKLNKTLPNHYDPDFWNAIHFYYDSDGNLHDNVLTANSAITITTEAVYDIKDVSVKTGGNITDDLGDNITARGVVWSLTPNPTLTTNELGSTTDGTGTGTFNSTISGLEHWTTYYVRAYATNSSSTVYGQEIMFTTVPTLGEWGLIAFGVLTVLLGGYFVYRKFIFS
jgi:hypothetical protein